MPQAPEAGGRRFFGHAEVDRDAGGAGRSNRTSNGPGEGEKARVRDRAAQKFVYRGLSFTASPSGRSSACSSSLTRKHQFSRDGLCLAMRARTLLSSSASASTSLPFAEQCYLRTGCAATSFSAAFDADLQRFATPAGFIAFAKARRL